MAITLNSGKITLLVDEINVRDSSSWKVVEAQNFRPDKPEFMLKRFKKDFPKQASAVNDFDMLTKLASRSKAVSEWYARVSAEYVLEINVPKYLKDIVEPKEFEEANTKIKELNKLAAERALDEQRVVKNYQQEMKKIEEDYTKKSAVNLQNKLVRILTLNSTSLPITLQLMIENFTPSTTSGSPDKKTYAREVLTQFKISLLKYFADKANKDADLEDFLTEISQK